MNFTSIFKIDYCLICKRLLFEIFLVYYLSTPNSWILFPIWQLSYWWIIIITVEETPLGNVSQLLFSMSFLSFCIVFLIVIFITRVTEKSVIRLVKRRNILIYTVARAAVTWIKLNTKFIFQAHLSSQVFQQSCLSILIKNKKRSWMANKNERKEQIRTRWRNKYKTFKRMQMIDLNLK